MTSAMLILAVAAIGTVAHGYSMAPPHENHGPAGRFNEAGPPHFGPPGGSHGGPPFGGPPPPFGGPGNGKFLRMKMLHFVHETLCYGLPGPNFTRGGNNDAHRVERPHYNGQRPPMSPAAIFRALVTRGVENATTTVQNFTNTPAVTNTTNTTNTNTTTNNSTAIEAEEARLIRVVARQVMSMWTLQGGDADTACAQLTAAEQKLIDFRKANNLTCEFEKHEQGRFPEHPVMRPPFDDEAPMFQQGSPGTFSNTNQQRPASAPVSNNGRQGQGQNFPQPNFSQGSAPFNPSTGNNNHGPNEPPHFNNNNNSQQQPRPAPFAGSNQNGGRPGGQGQAFPEPPHFNNNNNNGNSNNQQQPPRPQFNPNMQHGGRR